MTALLGVAVFAVQLGPPSGAVAGSSAVLPQIRGSSQDAPARLSGTGLYLADGSIDPRNRPFAPQYPLWTDGASKARWIRLPEGSKISVADLDAWRFPAGTTLWKEFSFHGRKVETRMLRVEADGQWTAATYVWNEEQTDAVLAPDEGLTAAVEVAPGRRHAIPGTADCIACHGGAPSPVLGFTALQLSDDRDPLAPHADALPAGAITLRTLVAEDRLDPPRPDLAANPPRIRSDRPVERAALGYLSGNCGSCHNARGPLARLGFAFLHSVANEGLGPEAVLASAVGAHGRFVVPGIDPERSFVIAPGAPERSVVLHRMGSRRASSQMPPFGSALRDEAAIELVSRWVLELDSGNAAGETPSAPGELTVRHAR